jgi:hypothetical protein
MTDVTRLINTLENLEVAAVDMGDYIIIPMVEWDANMNYRWQTAKQERLGSCPQVPSKHPPGPASSYFEECQKEAVIQRLGKELYDDLERRSRMPDISMCNNDDCPLAKKCYRHEAEPNKRWQSYDKFEGGTDCRGYWPMEENNEPRR